MLDARLTCNGKELGLNPVLQVDFTSDILNRHVIVFTNMGPGSCHQESGTASGVSTAASCSATGDRMTTPGWRTCGSAFPALTFWRLKEKASCGKRKWLWRGHKRLRHDSNP